MPPKRLTKRLEEAKQKHDVLERLDQVIDTLDEIAETGSNTVLGYQDVRKKLVQTGIRVLKLLARF